MSFTVEPTQFVWFPYLIGAVFLILLVVGLITGIDNLAIAGFVGAVVVAMFWTLIAITMLSISSSNKIEEALKEEGFTYVEVSSSTEDDYSFTANLDGEFFRGEARTEDGLSYQVFELTETAR